MIGLFFGSYVATSLLLFKYPHFIFKKKKFTFKCRNICHRGGTYKNTSILVKSIGAFENVENTLEAFQKSILKGADMLELDCHLTLDGNVVVVHDDNLKRLTGVSCRVANTNYKELPSLLPITNANNKANSQLSTDKIIYQIPLLEDIFKHFPNTPINIDIKVNNSELITKVAHLIRTYKREHITVWGSFLDSIENQCWKTDKNIPLYFSLMRVSLLVILYYTGVLPFVPLKESFLEIPVPSALLKIPRPEPLTKSKKFLYFLADKFLLKKSFIKHLEKRGIQTFLWTLNEEIDFEFAFKKLQVAGVMTDCPTKLNEYLNKLA